jgi:glycosyltransferase involved in cell wall biosynthesis
MSNSDKKCSGLRVLLSAPYPPPYGGIASHVRMLIPGLYELGAEDIAVVNFGSEEKTVVVDKTTIYSFAVKRHILKLFIPSNFLLTIRVFIDLAPARLRFNELVRKSVEALLINGVAKRHRSQVVSFYLCTNLELLPLKKYWGDSHGVVLSVFGEAYETPEFFSKRHKVINEMFNVADAVVSSSNHCARSYFSIGITRPIEAVYYGVELGTADSDVRNEFRDKHGIASDEIAVLFMGRFVKEMGLNVLLKAAPTLFSKNPLIRLLIAGASGDLSEKVSLLAAKYPTQVLVMQNVSFNQQANLYSAADLLVAPSFNQRACMGMAIKEAMAIGLPVVGGAGGGVPEAIVDGVTGSLVPLDLTTGEVDVVRFTASVLTLIENSALRKQFGDAGKSRTKEIFSVEKTNRRMAEIFMSAAGR